MPTIEKFNKTYIEKTVLPKQAQLTEGKQEYYWHAAIHGFGIKLTPTKATFFVQTRDNKGELKRESFGNYREMSLDEAERKAIEKLNQIRAGMNRKQKREAESTLQQTLDDYLNVNDLRLRPATKKLYAGAIRRCFADWKDLPITKITADMVAERQIAISNANGPRGKGEAHANQSMRILRTLINYAMLVYKDGEGKPVITSNPVKELKGRRLWNKNKTRNDIIADDQLADWYQAVQKIENETVRDFMLLCLFTGLRRGEAERLKWSSVRLTGNKPMLTIPAEDTKTNSEHKLPLPGFVVKMLQRRVRRIDNEYVFPGTKPGAHIVEPKRQIAKVIKMSSDDEQERIDFSMHTLRRTFSTIAGKLDISQYKHKMLMNHSLEEEVTGAHYVKLTVDDLREPMEKICAHICKHAGIDQPIEEQTGAMS